MPEQTPAFVVVDKRKFTADGAIREGYIAPEPEPVRAPEPPAQPDADSFSSAKLVTMPARAAAPEPGPASGALKADTREADAADDLADEDLAVPSRFPDADPSASLTTNPDDEIGLPRGVEETLAQDAAYKQTAREMDTLLLQANPGMQPPGVIGFEHLIQSFYLSAIMAMGAGTEPGQQPRIDILAARQSIDMLTVLEAKTHGNLSPDEQTLLQGITFEVRMMFLELTNAISQQAQQPMPTRTAPRPNSPGGLR